LLLNPDAHIDRESLGTLVATVEGRPYIGGAVPRIVHTDGSID
jgi:GT2 family glycosyltransferase